MDDVCGWLAAVQLGHLAPIFREHRMQGRSLLELSPVHFDTMGLRSLGDRLALQRELGLLAGQSTPTATDAALPASWMIARSHVTVGLELAHGQYVSVAAGTYQGQVVAVKVSAGTASGANGMQEAIREAARMKEISNHPNVLMFYGTCMDSAGTLIVTEFCALGDLATYVRARGATLEPAVRLRLALQIACGMAHLHAMAPPFLHRDLAARNVLLAESPHGLVAKISDFGVARLLHDAVITARGAAPVRWWAPELLDKRSLAAVAEAFLPASDVWAYGVTVWELYVNANAVPYSTAAADDAAVYQLVFTQRQCLERPALCPLAVWTSAVRPCFAFNPKERPPFARILATLQVMSDQQDRTARSVAP